MVTIWFDQLSLILQIGFRIRYKKTTTTGHCWEDWVISTTYLYIPFWPRRFHEKWNASPLPVVQHHFWHSGQIRFSTLCDITDTLLHTTTLIRGLLFNCPIAGKIPDFWKELGSFGGVSHFGAGLFFCTEQLTKPNWKYRSAREGKSAVN